MSSTESWVWPGSELADAIKLASGCINGLGNPEDNGCPWFGHEAPIPAGGDGRLFFSGFHDESHVPGRHLLALLEAETLGVASSADTLERNRRALDLSLSRELPLPQNRASLGAHRPTRFLPHNVRECVHGYLALYLHRRCAHASQARASIGRICAAIDAFWDPVTGWDRKAMVGVQPDLEVIEWPSPHITGLARAIGALTRFLVAAAERNDRVGPIERTLERIVGATLSYFPDTGVAANLGNHTHSITSVLSGLARYADWRGDKDVMRRVEAFYILGLSQYADQIGWSIENAGRPSDRGELNNSGDIVETALILARWGRPSCYDDVELIIRGHILPAQLTDGGFMVGPEATTGCIGDASRDVANRLVGAFGFPAPYGHVPYGASSVSFNTDIVGGVVSSLVQVAHQAAVWVDGELSIRLLLGSRGERYSFAVAQSEDELTMTFTVFQTQRLVIRVPAWVRTDTVQVLGADGWRIDAGWLRVEVPSHTAAARVVVICSVQRRRIDLGHALQPISMILSGARVVAADALRQPLPFFPPLGPISAPAESSSCAPTTLAVGTSVRLHSGATALQPPTTLTFPGDGAFAVAEPRQLGDFGRTPFTVALWVNSKTLRGRILSKSVTDGGCGYFLRFKDDSGRLEFCIGGGTLFAGAGMVKVHTEGILNSGQWHHLAVAVDMREGLLNLSLDGARQRLHPENWTQGVWTETGLRFPSTIRATASSMVPLMLASRLGIDQFFSGSMAGVSLINEALAEEHLSKMAESSFPNL